MNLQSSFYNTQIGKFISINPNWKELLSKPPYSLIIKEDGEYILFKYNQIESDFSNPIVQEARGIIFKKGNFKTPVCWAFNKFFNYGEPNASNIDWSTAYTTEKIDGSLIKMFYDNDKWHISTNGTINAYEAKYSNLEGCNFGELFEEALANNNTSLSKLKDTLVPDNTYMFELVSPKTRVVIPYEKTDVYYLGYRDNYTGVEYPFYTINYSVKQPLPLKIPVIYNLYNLKNCLEAAQNLPWNEEGYVVSDINCNRIKIKSPAYVLAHYTRSNNNISKETLLNISLEGEQDEFLTYASDYKSQIQELSEKVNEFISLCVNSLANVKLKTYSSRKEQALEILKYPNNVQPFLFANIENSVSFSEFTKDWTANKWLKYINN